MSTVSKVITGTVVLGVGVGVALRHLNLDPGCQPMPLLWPVPAGASRLALEVETGIAKQGDRGGAVVRRDAAERIIKALGDYDLVPVPLIGSAPEISGAFRLQAKTAATKGAPSAAVFLAGAAKAGADVLVNFRVTGLLNGVLPKASSADWVASDALIVARGYSRIRAVGARSVSQPGLGWELLGMRAGAGNSMPVDQQFALLIHGDEPAMALPSVPGLAKV
jgi:hypothetical protein